VAWKPAIFTLEVRPPWTFRMTGSGLPLTTKMPDTLPTGAAHVDDADTVVPSAVPQ